jgi:hypothetical protein
MSTTTTVQATKRLYVSGRGYITLGRIMEAVQHNNDPELPDHYLHLRVSETIEMVALLIKKARQHGNKRELSIEGFLLTGESFTGSYDLTIEAGPIDVTEL